MTGQAPNWDLYRTLLAVLRGGSLAAAARELGLTQPTVSRHIDELEAALGQPLFLRTQRGVTPLDGAHALRPFAEAIEAAATALRRAADERHDGIAGTVRISASEVIGIEVLPPVLAELMAQHPRLELELSVSNELDDLLQRQADVAVRMLAPTQQSLVARRVGQVPLGLFAHRDYLARRGTPADLAALAGHTLVGVDRETPSVRALLARLPALANLTFAFRADSQVAHTATVRSGLGIGLMQRPLAARDPALVELLPGALELGLDTWIVMHEDLRGSPRCRAVFDALHAGLTAYLHGGHAPS